MNVAVYFVLLGCWAVIGQAAPTEQQLFDVEVEVLETLEDGEETEGYFQGDIELDNHRNALTTGDLWQSGEVPYVISSSFPSRQKLTIMMAMREIESDTKHESTFCIRYRPKNSSDTDYISIEKLTGCHSPIGRRGGKSTISLGFGCDSKGVIMHELLHSLGFYHEQSRYDRDDYVDVHLDNILEKNKIDFEKGTKFNMATYGESYDYRSIMHYDAYAFAADPSKPSITPKSGMARDIQIGQRRRLSKSDVIKIQSLYGCYLDTKHITTPGIFYEVKCNFEYDLCNMLQDSSDDFEWTRRSGSTPSKDTGPNGDHTNGIGYYVYAEASGHKHKYARLKTQTIPAGSYCVSFALFDHGKDAGNFTVKIEGNEVLNRDFVKWSVSQKNAWIVRRLYVTSQKPFYLVFESYIGGGVHGDMALDDVEIYHGKCII